MTLALTIEAGLAAKVPALALGCIRATVAVSPHDAALWRDIQTQVDQLSQGPGQLPVEEITALTPVAAQRGAYKACGKNPSRYRGSAEALLRRVAQGKGLFQVNTIVDINNLVSLQTRQPVGSYDYAKLDPPLRCRIGQPGETYQGIGKDAINLEHMPLLADQTGPIGSPTADSQRAAISEQTRELLLIIYSFSGSTQLDDALSLADGLLTRYAAAKALTTAVITVPTSSVS